LPGYYHVYLTVSGYGSSHTETKFNYIQTTYGETGVADILEVNWDGSGQYQTIQDAIDAAENQNIILIADGTYTGERNRNL